MAKWLWASASSWAIVALAGRAVVGEVDGAAVVVVPDAGGVVVVLVPVDGLVVLVVC